MSGAVRRGVAVVAVDGGNSKTDLWLVGYDGRLLATHHGPTISHQQIGLDPGADRVRAAWSDACDRAGLDSATPAAIGAYALAGADTPADERRLAAAFAARGLADRTLVVNDAFAPVRAGSERGWGVGVICGAGVNAAGIAPDGRTARFAALGAHAGDWGGAGDLGMAALGAAVRARDGRGARTALETLVPAHFELARPIDVTRAVEDGDITSARLRELSPVVFRAAKAGDTVACAILDRQADELATMAVAIARRLHLIRRDVDVTLAGGVFRAEDAAFEARIAAGVRAIVTAARVHRLGPPPVLGAALLGLDRLEVEGALSRAAQVAAAGRLREAAGTVSIHEG